MSRHELGEIPGPDDEYIPEPGHGRMPRVLAMAWTIGLAFLAASVAYAIWRY